jgi:hypothetical protein
MARRNLSRTAIEGGRTKSSKWERWRFTKDERVRFGHNLRGVHNDGEAADELALDRREKAYKVFDDKLSPVHRWLVSQCGRPWDKVRSEVHEKFDSRTTAGRHILFDHIIGDVGQLTDEHRGYYRFIVDKHGLLREAENEYDRQRARRRASRPRAFHKNDVNRLLNWLGSRRVGYNRDKLSWFQTELTVVNYWHHYRSASKRKEFDALLVPSYWSASNSKYGIYYFTQKLITGKSGYNGWEPFDEPKLVWEVASDASKWVYSRHMEERDVKYFASLPDWVQEMVLKGSPSAAPAKTSPRIYR